MNSGYLSMMMTPRQREAAAKLRGNDLYKELIGYVAQLREQAHLAMYTTKDPWEMAFLQGSASTLHELAAAMAAAPATEPPGEAGPAPWPENRPPSGAADPA